MSTTVPNHSQASRIRFDVQSLQNHADIKPWKGNSYSGHQDVFYETLEDGFTKAHTTYDLMHWSTTIASITRNGVLYFDARYISATTRGFQGRILNALRTAFGESHPDVVRISQELGKPTSQRGILY